MQVHPVWRGKFLLLLVPLIGRVAAQTPPAVPAWLEPYPGVTVETKSIAGSVNVTYEAPATLAAVIGHYRALFAAQSLPFQPETYGATAVIRGEVPGCALTILARQKAHTVVSVQITATQRPAVHRITEQEILHSMQKYDQPVYPSPKAPLPPLAWPAWLTTCEDVSPPIRKGVDRFKLNYLEVEFDSTQDLAAIRQFYLDLLNAHDYPVRVPNAAALEGTHNFGDSGRFVVRVEPARTAAGYHVVVRITAHR